MLFGVLISLFFQLNVSHAAEVIKVASWNFNSEVVPEDKNEDLREIRFQALLDWVQKESPDIIFIEEGWNFRGYPSIVIPLGRAIGYEYTYRLTMGLNGFLLDSNGILIKKGFKWDEKYNFELPHHAPSIGNGSGWIVSFGSTSWGIGGRITSPAGNPIYAYATHLISSKESDRAEDVFGLHQRIEKEIIGRGEKPADANIIIAGDFNAGLKSSVLIGMRDLGYSDTFADAHPDMNAEDTCTECSDPESLNFNPVTIAPGQFPTQNDINGNEHIDYVMMRSKTYTPLASTLIFTEPLNGVWMSDHYGVMSTFLLGKNEGALPQIANPLRDRTRSSEPSQVIEITDETLICDQDGCQHHLPEVKASTASGLTFINHSRRKVHVTVSGDARIWPRNFAIIPPGKANAFFFEEGQHQLTYSVWRPLSRKKVFGTVQTHTPK